ncbi:MAG: hypothetical protein ACRDRO_29100, partial [Pseudonocardiaceae bacterium]
MSGSVLVLTRRMDPTADVVVDGLNRRAIPVIRFDLGPAPGSVIGHVLTPFWSLSARGRHGVP